MIDNIRKAAVNNNNISDYCNKITNSLNINNNLNITSNDIITTIINKNSNEIIQNLTINDVKASIYYKVNSEIDLNILLKQDILLVNDSPSLDLFLQICNKINEDVKNNNNNINIGIDCEWKPTSNSNDNYICYVRDCIFLII